MHLWDVFVCVCFLLAYINKHTGSHSTMILPGSDCECERICANLHTVNACKCLCACPCSHLCVHAHSCFIVEPQRCGSGWAKRSKERKWRQMNREELNTLPVSSILLIPAAHRPLPPPPPFSFPSLSLRKYYKATQKDSRHGNEKRKSVALFVLLSRHRQLIQQWRLAGACGAIIPTLKPAVHGRRL